MDETGESIVEVVLVPEVVIFEVVVAKDKEEEDAVVVSVE